MNLWKKFDSFMAKHAGEGWKWLYAFFFFTLFAGWVLQTKEGLSMTLVPLMQWLGGL